MTHRSFWGLPLLYMTCSGWRVLLRDGLRDLTHTDSKASEGVCMGPTSIEQLFPQAQLSLPT